MKISQNDYTVFVEEFETNYYPYCRFGQAFWNKFYKEIGHEYENLFYEANRGKAEEIIWKYYIEH